MKTHSIVGRAFVAILALACVLLQPGWCRAQASPLVMGLASTDSRQFLLGSWRPVLDDLSKRLGRPVQAVVLDDYAGVIWSMAADRVQIAWLGNKAAIEAVDRAGAEVVVQATTKYGTGYYAHLIARREAPWNGADDVLDHAGEIEFGIGDPNSTSGFTVPSYYLFASRGVDPAGAFKRLVHHNHEENFLAVATGQLDVATNNSSALGRYRERFPEQYKRIKIIWTSPRIPSDPVLVRSDLAPALKAAIRDFFVGYARPGKGKTRAEVRREAANLAARKWVGFQESDNSQLAPIRRLELYKKRLKLERDETLSGAERRARLDEVDAGLRALDRE
jgi:phosphonate transport system substrate-binding protein